VVSPTATLPTVTIGGTPATVTFSGLAGCCVGLNQINVTIPPQVALGPDVPLILKIGDQTSNTVTIATGSILGGIGPSLQAARTQIANLGVMKLGLDLAPPILTTGAIVFTGSGSLSGGKTVVALTGSGSGTISSCQLVSTSHAAGEWSASST